MELSKIVKLISAQQSEIKTNPKLLENHFKIDKTYLPLHLKRQIVKNIVNLSIYEDEETKMLMHDMSLQDLMTVLFITIECTDIEIKDLFVETTNEETKETENKINWENAAKIYDKLMQFGIYKYIEERLENNDIPQLVDYEVKQRLSVSNSVAHVVLKCMEKLISIIPSQDKIQDLIKTLPQAVSNLGGLQFLGGLSGNKPVSENTVENKIETPIKVIELSKKEIIGENIETPLVTLDPLEEIITNEENLADVKDEDLEVVKIEKPKTKKKSKKTKKEE